MYIETVTNVVTKLHRRRKTDILSPLPVSSFAVDLPRCHRGLFCESAGRFVDILWSRSNASYAANLATSNVKPGADDTNGTECGASGQSDGQTDGRTRKRTDRATEDRTPGRYRKPALGGTQVQEHGKRNRYKRTVVVTAIARPARPGPAATVFGRLAGPIRPTLVASVSFRLRRPVQALSARRPMSSH